MIPNVVDFDNEDEKDDDENEKEEAKPEEVVTEENLQLAINEQTEEEALSDEINSDFIGDYDPTRDLEYYKMPPIELLKDYPTGKSDVTRDN